MKNLQQVIDDLIEPSSQFYNQQIVDMILKDYVTIEDFKASEEYQSIIGLDYKN